MEYIRQEFKPLRINASAITVVSTGKSFIGRLVINKALTGTVQIWDSTNGTTNGTTIAVIAASTAAGTFMYDASLANGLTIITSSASDDITVMSSNN